MLATLIRKELKAILVSPKFVATFAVCSVLILVSVYTGIVEYQSSVKQYQAAVDLNEQRLQEQTSWGNVVNKVFRRPDPLQIFAAGLTFDIGRWSLIFERFNVKLMGSSYSQDPIFALFRFVDFAFIVLFVLTLLAILFTYDTISGEKEGGTLRLVFSNAVPRAHYLIAKGSGAWLALVVSILIPTLLAVLLVVICGVPLQANDWVRVMSLIVLALSLFTFFIFFGVMISALTRRSSVSFLVCLVCWVGFVMIIPRAGVMAAGNIIEVPRMAEIEGQRDAFASDSWKQFYEEARERWQNADADPGQMTDEEWEKMLWNRM
ncbi:MAG: ABC transporter permease subunit, partial [Candidatus Zixiibacteriota bacterium]